MQGANLPMANPMLAGQAAGAAGQQMVGVRLPNGQVIVMQAQQAYALAAQQQQQLAAYQQQQQALGSVRPAAPQQPNAAQLAAMTAIQQRLAQSGQPAAGAVRPQQQQQLLMALQQQQAAKQQAAAARTPEPLQMGFTQEQLVVLKEQIMLFKAVKKGTEPVTQEALQRCKPPPLPPPPPRSAAAGQAGVSAAIPGLVGALKPMAPVVATSAAANPAAIAALQQQLQRQQQQPAALAQQALQQRNLAAAAQQRGLASSAAGAAARPSQQQPGGAAGAAAAQAEAPTGPTTPPMEVPVRRPAGPLLGMLPPADLAPGAGAPPSLNVDVPRMLLREFHHRMNRARGRRTHELEALLRRKDLPVGHGRGPEGLPGRAAVLLELRKLRLWNMQVKVRSLLEREEEEIVNMPDKIYRDLSKRAAKYKQQLDIVVQQKQHERWERLYIERMQYKKLATDRFVMYRDMHLLRNKQLGRLHERLARELNKQKMDDNDRRLEALKANDFEAYKELLRQTYGPLSDDDRFAEVERFLNETEEYINKLTKKLVQYKAEEQAGEAVQEAIAEARMLELSEEEVKVRAAAAQQEHMATNELLTQVHTLGGDAQSRFTQLAHNIREKVTRQPAYLKPPKNGKLREYQMVGLEWMLSLYNNKLNGILADEMGLGKTVQVMALLAYLYEFKQNYGPHLIIVPNAVIVNWKAELNTWLPDFRCVYYTGNKDERALKFQNEVQSMQFNILVTTYETIMRDRSKLSKLEWKYIIIDEAQRMKDRESKLSQDLNKFTTARRLLLTGTPLQNELKELWSLLNLLLPDVFNDSNTFSEWFTKFLGVDSFADNGAGGAISEAAALDREKKILVVNRLHQILSPFMLRRMVKDVEQQLPEKVTITVKCPMSAYQSAVYNWIKTTNTIRVDPAHRRAAHGQRAWEPLQNKVMELRKVCNHPRLCYPDSEHFWGHDVVRTCGKMFWLDRMLVKLHASGHRVLLFSTMTRMLDTVEFYLNWRQVDSPDGSGEKVFMQSRRIDGATSLEQREAAIQEFNRPNSEVFIFLLSIRAAGRGLNLQTSDTVIIYDPDPNPKNEEQAIARSHRIGQTKEVRVFHLEAISDPADSFPPPVYQPRRGDAAPASGAAGAAAAVMDGQQPSSSEPNGDEQQPSRFADSIESLMRNIIQKQKIDMANEVIDAGRFDMQTTNEERRKTLEEMLLDEDRLRTATNEAPTLESFNRQLARSSAEFEQFQRLDQEAWWPGELFGPQEVPDYLCYAANEAQEVLQITDRRPARIGVLATAERKAQGLTGQPESSGRGRGRGHKPPKPSRLGLAPGAAGHQLLQQPEMPAVLSVSDLAGPSGGVRPSQSVGSFLGGTSLASGLGEEGDGEEEVVGGTASGMYEDIEEEVVDERNIDEEFEQVLEQAEDMPAGAAAAAPAAAANGGGGSGIAGAAGLLQPGSVVSAVITAGAAAAQQQHQTQGHQQQEQQPQQPIQYHVTFVDEQQQAAEPRVTGGTAAATANAATATGGEEDDWEDVDKQPDGIAVNGTDGGVGAAFGAGAASKRSWGQVDALAASDGVHGSGYSGGVGGYSSGVAWPSMSGGVQATSSGMPSSSQGGMKKIKLSLKRPVPSPQQQQQ